MKVLFRNFSYGYRPSVRNDHSAEDAAATLRQVKVGGRLRVRPGEKVPVDGVVLEGRSRGPGAASEGSTVDPRPPVPA